MQLKEIEKKANSLHHVPKRNSLAQLYILQQVQLFLGNLTLARIQLKFSEKPHIQFGDFLYHGLNYCDWTHSSPIFPKERSEPCVDT